MKWLFEKAEKKSGYYTANYWVTGKAMHRDTMSWQPDDSLTDTAFQLLKAGYCVKFYQENAPSSLALATEIIENSGGPWIENLEKLDRRGCCAWPHAQQADTDVFRLDDHVWIWRALKIIEDSGLWPKRAESEKGMKRPRDVQQEILRRFMTENETSRKRMLAVTRSSRETRFLLHARDTALFYEDDWISPLQQASFLDMWKNTLKAQALHEINHDAFWDNTLRYAMAIMMSIRRERINQQPAHDLAKSCIKVIFQCMSLSGFCPGELDEITKEPVLFDREGDRDYFFHASFEVPFIFLFYASSIERLCEEQPKATDTNEVSAIYEQAVSSTEHPEGPKAQPKRQQALSEGIARESGPMKKTVPSSHLFDSNSIIDIEEEWLYNYPAFLMNDTERTPKEIQEILKNQNEQGVDASADVDDHVIVKQARRVLQQLELSESWIADEKVERSVLADIRKTKKLGRNQRNSNYHFSPNYCNNNDLKAILMRPRDAMDAKKRLILLPDADAETALICVVGSTDTEQPAMSLFFDRHWRKEEYFFDDTTMVMNTWETELHLSFYCIQDAEEDPSTSIRTMSEDIFPGGKKRISKTSIGFRFNGDFFDRYWTCHFIEDIGNMRDYMYNGKFPFTLDDKVQGWRQRKVLELHFFEHILSTLIKGTRDILNEVKRGLSIRQGQGAFPSSMLSSEDYFHSSARWQRYRAILQVVDETLEDVELEVSKWESREKDRGQERPRWTRNDERKYGGIIKKFQRSTNKQIRNLHSVHASVKSVKDTYTKGQEQTREDLSLRKSEDIRFFTYVTVVFLPLGFASSIFSMNGTPPGDLVVNLVICAIVALTITVIALFNAKTLAHITERAVRLIEEYSQSKMERSILIVGSTKEMVKEVNGSQDPQLEKGQDLPIGNSLKHSSEIINTNYQDKSIGTLDPSRFWFLMVYILLELPARRVAIAYNILRRDKLTWIEYMHVVLGFIFLPFCVIFSLIQVMACNIIDFVKLLFSKCPRTLPLLF